MYRDLDDKPLVRRHLKIDAVPSVFPNAPQYLSSKPTTVRSTTGATYTSRREQEDKHIDLLEIYNKEVTRCLR